MLCQRVSLTMLEYSPHFWRSSSEIVAFAATDALSSKVTAIVLQCLRAELSGRDPEAFIDET